jgi:hypothetical protein
VPCSSAIFKFREVQSLFCKGPTAVTVDQHTLSSPHGPVVLGSHTQTALSNVSDMTSCTSCATSARHVFVRECQKTWPDCVTNAGCFTRCCTSHAVLARPTQHAREWGIGGSTRACTPPAIWPLSFGAHTKSHSHPPRGFCVGGCCGWLTPSCSAARICEEQMMQLMRIYCCDLHVTHGRGWFPSSWMAAVRLLLDCSHAPGRIPWSGGD